MVEELKNLIEKIQNEGVAAAEEKARNIEEAARREAKDVLEKAKTESGHIIAKGREETSRMEERARASLKQAGRDLLLHLRQEIYEMLNRLVKERVSQALSRENLAEIISSLIKARADGPMASDISLLLSKKDREGLRALFASELKDAVKKGVRLGSSDSIGAGFTISYDGEKSCFDFTDEALAEYLANYLKPHLAELLKESVKKK